MIISHLEEAEQRLAAINKLLKTALRTSDKKKKENKKKETKGKSKLQC